RDAAVALGDVVDQLLDQHGLADAGAAEQADLTAAGIRGEKVDDLDAGDENCCLGGLVDEFRRLGVDGRGDFAADRATLVDRLADDVEDAAESLGADRHGDLGAGVDHFLAASQAVRRVHGDGANSILAEVLRDFKDEPVTVVVGFQCAQDGRQLTFEGDVDDGADDLGYGSFGRLVEHGGGGHDSSPDGWAAA